jgi:uncharacterized iron-regulated membrane protein
MTNWPVALLVALILAVGISMWWQNRPEVVVTNPGLVPVQQVVVPVVVPVEVTPTGR